jgi:phosphatidylserine/phosphatidylglycerophosphate/cardiolipin synthase-like enzyme
VHSKLAIIDDRWASVGTANKDGASLNQRQWGLILLGTLEELPPLKKALATLLTPVFVALMALTAAPLVLLAASAISFPTLMPFLVDTIKKEIARTTQHANPNRDRQPPRHPELNVVLYDGIAGQPATDKVKELRSRLWKEQLGGDPPPVKPPGGWLSHWRSVAETHKNNIRAASEQPSAGAPTRTKILEWAPPRDYRDNLRALGIKTENKKNITVRDTGEKMRFTAVDAQ